MAAGTLTITPYGLGMRGTGDWVTDQRPKNWRDTVLFMYPNGMVPLTAMLSRLSSESTDDPEFNWWTKNLPQQGGAVTNILKEDGTDYAASTDQAAGTIVKAHVALAVAKEFRPGHEVLLRDASNYTNDVSGKVLAVAQNGANSTITIKLLVADGTGAGDLSDCDRILIIGNINPEGGYSPVPVGYDPVKYYNYTQIFRTSLELTRTARKTRLRTGDAKKEMTREALELHMMEMEKALLFGPRTENVGENGKPERTTWGIIPMTISQGNSWDYTLESDTAWAGDTWVTSGEDWFNTRLEEVFRYGRNVKMAYCGSGAILGIQKLVKAGSQMNISVKQAAYGIKVLEWVTPFGTVLMKTHPLFSYEATNRNSMLLFEPENLKERYITQTMKKPIEEEGKTSYDGSKEEFLTEMGLEYHHPITFTFLNGVGLNNTVGL